MRYRTTKRRPPKAPEAPDVKAPEKVRDISLIIRDVHRKITGFFKETKVRPERETLQSRAGMTSKNLVENPTDHDIIFIHIGEEIYFIISKDFTNNGQRYPQMAEKQSNCILHFVSEHSCDNHIEHVLW